jgi:hypothetical protein
MPNLIAAGVAVRLLLVTAKQDMAADRFAKVPLFWVRLR